MHRAFVDVNDCPKGNIEVDTMFWPYCPNKGRVEVDNTWFDPMRGTFVDVSDCPKGCVEVEEHVAILCLGRLLLSGRQSQGFHSMLRTCVDINDRPKQMVEVDAHV